MTNAVNIAQIGSNNTTFRNRLINPAMVIDQRNAGASVTIPSTLGQYTLDRWWVQSVSASKFTVQQTPSATETGFATRVGAGFTNYLAVTSLAATSAGSTDYYGLFQQIEGFNTADLAWGTANAKTITLSFLAYSSLTGTFSGSLRNSANNRSYPFSYSIPTANTWTSISVTIAGDTSGTWLTNNSTGIGLVFDIGAGSNYRSTANSWQAGNYYGVTSAVSVLATNGATFYITGVQLEAGSTASPFEYRSYGTELVLCQRYAASTFPIGTAWGQNRGASGCVIVTSPGAGVGFGVQVAFRFPVTMRATPTTITSYNPAAANANARYFPSSTDLSTSMLPFSQNSMNSICFTPDTVGTSIGAAIGLHISVEAEL
jgi:hypothetical protein